MAFFAFWFHTGLNGSGLAALANGADGITINSVGSIMIGGSSAGTYRYHVYIYIYI